MKFFRKVICITSFSILVAACGGGDDSSNPIANSPLPPPVANYSVVELPRLPGHRGAQATDINDMGQIVGWSIGDTGPQTAVVWNIDPAGTITVQSLGLLPGGTGSFATGINNLGQIVGFADSTLGDRRPFIWTANGGIRDLGIPTGLIGGQAQSINDNGQVVGAVYQVVGNLFDVGQFAIWIVDQDGMFVAEQNLGPLGGRAATAWDNNVHGNVAGNIWFGTLDQTAFFWSMVGGVIEINNTDEGLGINDNDEVVGLRVGQFDNQAFVRSSQGGVTLIPDTANAMSINNSGQVTGLTNIGNNGQAYIWQAGQLQLLPMLDNRDFSWGLAINESGWVVGWSTDRLGNEFANLWMPN